MARRFFEKLDAALLRAGCLSWAEVARFADRAW
jgi:hypothetical protein